MKNEIEKAVEKMVQHLEELLSEATNLKKAINVMRKTIGEAPLYDEVEEAAVKANTTSIRQDQYFGMPMTSAAKEILKAKGSAMSTQDILEQMEKGGFNFDAVGWKEGLRLRNLAISLRKNSNDFIRVPSGADVLYGLKEFYPNLQKNKARKKNGKEVAEENEEIIVDEVENESVENIEEQKQN